MTFNLFLAENMCSFKRAKIFISKISKSLFFRPTTMIRMSTLLLVSTALIGSKSQPLDNTNTEEQNRIASERIQAGAPVFDTR
jgi:hypothetical protein